ncbi:MAG TPA: hypothetical protein VFK07_03195 [Candidatus Paceibacterota bacterium]|nr:hypothetical protein [Candidatus Paceibacterota bacterium]
MSRREMAMKVLKTVVFTVLVAGTLIGQALAQSVMTNKQVIDMIKAGLSADLVVTTIHAAKTVKFDTSSTALIELKKAGVPNAVISAMMAPTKKVEATAVNRDPAAPPQARGYVTIPDGTEVHLRLLERVSSATAQIDDRVRFEAADDVLVNGKIVIAQGAKGYGTVIEAKHKKSFGRSGKLDFTIDVVDAVDGQNVRLRATKRMEGDEHYAKAGVLSLIAWPAGFFIKGKDITVEAGKVYTIYIDGDRRIDLGGK